MSLNDDNSVLSEDVTQEGAHDDDSIDNISFLDLAYSSDEVSKIVEFYKDDSSELKQLHQLENSDTYYDRHTVLPQWIIKSEGFRSSKVNDDDDELDEILRLPTESRTNDQNSILTNFVMNVWDVAKNMGYTRVSGMVKSFQYLTYHQNDYIFEEGQRGLTFYIIISGACNVIKEGIGVVAMLEKGKSFGEIALTQGKDLRTASIQCSSKQVDVLSLHKIDYERYVKDIQISENREHLACLKACPLFLNWSRQLLEKISRTCSRKKYSSGEFVYRFNDEANLLYMLLEGNVSIIKTVCVTSTNRWPTGMKSWDHKSHSVTKNYNVASLCKVGDYFGEISLIRGCNRTETVLCNNDTTLVCLDKLEFLHLIDSGKAEIATALNIFKETQEEDEERARKLVTIQRKASRKSSTVGVGGRRSSSVGGRRSSSVGGRKASTIGGRKASFLGNSVAVAAVNKESAKKYFSKFFENITIEDNTVITTPEYTINPETLAPLKQLPFTIHRPIQFNKRANNIYNDDDSTVTFAPFAKRLDVSSGSSLNGVITKLELVDKDGRKSRINKPISMSKFLDYMRDMSINKKNYHDHDDYSVTSYSSQGGISLGSSLTNSQMSQQSISTSVNSMSTLLLNPMPVTPIKSNKLQPTHLLHKAKLTYRDVIGK